MAVDFRTINSLVIVNDPVLVNDFYVTKNKYFDKDTDIQRRFTRFIGDSILFSKSHEVWS